MTTDNTQELDEILRSLAHQAYLTAHAPGYTKLDGRTYKTAVDEAKQAILDWHNKQVEEVLDSLEAEMKHYRTHDMQPPFPRAIPMEAIEAERNKLKESK